MADCPGIVTSNIVDVSVGFKRMPLLLLASLAAQSKCVHLVVWGSDIVTRAPIEGAVRDGWPIDWGTLGVETPEDIPGCRVQRIHFVRLRGRIQDAICNTHRANIIGGNSRVCGLPDDLPGGDVKCRPRPPRNTVSRRQGIWDLAEIRDSDINLLTIGCGAPLNAS